MADLYTDDFNTGWNDIPNIPSFLDTPDTRQEPFDNWDDTPPPELLTTPQGRSFFIYRSCDLSATGTREAISRNNDIINRAIALIDDPSGTPAEEQDGSDNPTVDITDAEWTTPTPGQGTLEPGTYLYEAVPVDTCTGRTGTPVPLPALTIRALGEVATLRASIGTPAEECDALIIRRDGEIVGPVFPDLANTNEVVTVIEQPNPYGNYDNGTDKDFRRLDFDSGDPNDTTSPTANPISGRPPGPAADLVGGDAVRYNGFNVVVDQVDPWPPASTVDTGQGQYVRFQPPIPATLVSPPGVYDSANRSGFYEAVSTLPNIGQIYSGGLVSIPTNQYTPTWPPGTEIRWPGPLASFVKTPPSTFGILPYLDDVQPGDIIAIGSKTGLVVYVERNPNAFPDGYNPFYGTVLYVPFGILPIPPLPIGQYWVVYRSEIVPTFFFYYTLGKFFRNNIPAAPAPVEITDFNDPRCTALRLRPTFAGGGGLDPRDEFLYQDGGSGTGPDGRNNGYDPADLPNKRSNIKAFRVVSYDVVEDPPGSGRRRPEFLPRGQLLVYDLQLVTVQIVNEIMQPTGLFPGEYEVEVTPLSGAEYEFNPGDPIPALEVAPPVPVVLPDGLYLERPVTPIGPALTIPSAASPYLRPAVISPFGQYERLTRLAEFRTELDVWEYVEDGADGPTGAVDGSDAREEVDGVFVQNNYPGGLDGLLERVRGSQATLAQDVFVKTLGTLTQAGGRLFGCNSPVAGLGSGSVIDLGVVRGLWEQLCSETSRLSEMISFLSDDGYAIARLEVREVQVPAARCPPDQPDARELRLFCLGFATEADPLRDGEVGRVLFNTGVRFTNNLPANLVRRGLSKSEADNAVLLVNSDRIISVAEITETDLGQIEDWVGLSADPTELDDILNDDRIETVNTGTLNQPQIQEIIRRRGVAGIAFRAPGTDETDENPAADEPVEDFVLLGHELAALTYQLQRSFDVCDYDAALQSVEDPELRVLLGSFFAIVESVLEALVQAGRAVTNFLDNPDFEAAVDAIAGIVVAAYTDPTFACFGGPAAASPQFPGAPSLPTVDALFSGFSSEFQQKFNLSQLFGQALGSVLCSVIGALVEVASYFGRDIGSAAARQSVACIPTLDEIADLGLAFPSLEVQLAVECSLEQLNILLDITNALVAEANEVIDFGNELNTGFVARTVAVRNRACSSGQGITSLVSGLRAYVGLG